MNNKLLEIFRAKTNHPEATQRELAQQVALSLGKVNQGLDQLKKMGLLNDKMMLSSVGQDYLHQHLKGPLFWPPDMVCEWYQLILSSLKDYWK